MSTTQEAHDLYNSFVQNVSVDRLQKILTRYEQMKMIENVPGDIVECGVFKGTGFYTFAKLCRIMMPNSGRKLIGFDLFGTKIATKLTRADDKKFVDWHVDKTVKKEEIVKNLAAHDIHNVELIAGDVTRTTKEYAAKNPGFRIALLYLDVDNYDGTMAILKHFFPLVVPGGLVVFDDYGQRGHGESDAVHEFFKGTNYKLHMPQMAPTTSAYIVKEGL